MILVVLVLFGNGEILGRNVLEVHICGLLIGEASEV